VNYEKITQNIIKIAESYGRDPNSITLVAVSKGHSISELIPLYNAGQRIFGESRQQEATAKIESAPDDISWHFIGNLQKNKVRKIIGRFALIHSVDSPELAQKISDCSLELGVVTDILLQVNISGELTKHGLSPENWKRFIEQVKELPSISLKGFMTMAPADSDETYARKCFAGLREFRDSLPFYLPHLSMGMSHDYPWAIAEGATLVRIGSALFK
jgi:pyridoxal phosphate enzyme (YggS family)